MGRPKNKRSTKGGSFKKRGKNAKEPSIRGQPLVTDTRYNEPPPADDDDFNVPQVPGRSFMGDAGIPDAPGQGSAGSGVPSKAQKKRARQANAPDGSSNANGKVGADGKPKPKPPRQRPGESVRSFNERVDRHMRESLTEVSKKMSTEQHREKKRTRAEAKRKKLADRKTEARENAKDKSSQPTDRPGFGDVVLRPPALNPAKSLTKVAKASAGGQASPAQEGTGTQKSGTARPKDFADYAAQVREAYDALKKRRLNQREQREKGG
mmetsp:Transcript_102475/g.290207  ORF Transcript_102475/g.290207 Transcript_102475/m.290207 type:complete len:266 (+) Transcript_102475:109-906(+)